ncbi:hypothetical protein PCANC_21286 [Puccinia coronata f. sp. avenae]|uniref:PARP-type domain-containing protein n=1 Tax=Puccinia coronata f. sp. avenae TaxID=200324 RepID=A0A2N5SE21_9BASI|nr:hypothetical protein PCANC_21286 [Puccinia coronata f. sp. avenae]
MTGYRVEYASSGRAKCNGRKPCQGTAISKGQIRFGTWVTIHEKGSFKWRHWGCLTSSVLQNVSNELEGKIDELDGIEELESADQEKIKKAFQDGQVDPGDVPPTAVAEETGNPAEDDDDADKKETKKRKRAPAKKAKANAKTNAENLDQTSPPDGQLADGEKAPKKKKSKAVKKPPASSD